MYNVEIITGRRFPFKKFPGVKQVSERKYSIKNLSKKEAKRIVRRAKLHLFIAHYYDQKWERGKGYKKKWIIKNPSDTHRCVYCNRKIPYKSITLDHVVPIYAAKQSRVLQWILERRGFDNIDDERNLVPACYHCNKLKGKSTSFVWMIRAYLGKYKLFWIIFYTFLGIVVISLLYYILLFMRSI